MLTLVAVGSSVVFLTYVLFKSAGRDRDWTWPVAVFSGVFLIIHFIVPALNENFFYYRFTSGYGADAKGLGAIISAFFLSIVIVTFELASRLVPFSGGPELRRDQSTMPAPVRGAPPWFTAACILIGGAFACWLAYKIVAIGGIRVYFQNRIFYSHGAGYAVALSNLFPLGACLASYHLIRRRGWSPLTIAVIAAFTIFWLAVCSLRGTRLEFFLLVVPLAFSLLIGRWREPYVALARMAPIAVMLFLVATVAGSYRRIVVTRESLQWDSRQFLGGVNGVFGNHENLLWLIEAKRDLTWAATYIAGFANLIPRAVWPDKPLGGGPTLVNLIFTNQYQIGRPGASSLTTGLLPEAVMSFGLIGSLGVAVVFGIVLALLCRALRSARSDTAVVGLAFCTYFVAVAAPFSEFLGLFTMATVVLIPTFIIAKIFNGRS